MCTVLSHFSDENGSFSSLETNFSHLHIFIIISDLTTMLIVCDGPGQIVKLWECHQHSNTWTYEIPTSRRVSDAVLKWFKSIIISRTGCFYCEAVAEKWIGLCFWFICPGRCCRRRGNRLAVSFKFLFNHLLGHYNWNTHYPCDKHTHQQQSIKSGSIAMVFTVQPDQPNKLFCHCSQWNMFSADGVQNWFLISHCTLI